MLKKTMLIAVTFVTILLVGTSCDNDSNPSPNDDQCEYNGLTWYDGSTNTLIPDSDLNTQFFPNASNGPNGSPGIEIAGSAADGTFIHFSTNVITEGDTGTGTVTLPNTGQVESVTVTCQRATGTQVGDEYRYDVVFTNNAEMEFCVTIDEIL